MVVVSINNIPLVCWNVDVQINSVDVSKTWKPRSFLHPFALLCKGDENSSNSSANDSPSTEECLGSAEPPHTAFGIPALA